MVTEMDHERYRDECALLGQPTGKLRAPAPSWLELTFNLSKMDLLHSLIPCPCCLSWGYTLRFFLGSHPPSSSGLGRLLSPLASLDRSAPSWAARDDIRALAGFHLGLANRERLWLRVRFQTACLGSINHRRRILLNPPPRAPVLSLPSHTHSQGPVFFLYQILFDLPRLSVQPGPERSTVEYC